MNDAPTILAVRSLTKRFGGVVALQQVSFDLRPGEVHALCGENGAGKSTLIKCLSGVWPHGTYEGEFSVHGQLAAFAGLADARRVGISVIYQELALVGEMTVAENIFLGCEPTVGGLIDWNRIYAETAALLKRYGLKLDPTARIKDLGIGQQQLVEIVKALAKDSRILLLDEPTAALTETEVEVLLKIVKDLRQHGVTCVYISHKLDEVLAIADRVTILRDGSTIATLETRATTKDEIIRHMVGRPLGNLFPKQPQAPGEVLLAVRGLSVREPGEARLLLENISFELRRGEVLGIGGLMGAGRTELLMHLFCGIGERMAGEVTLAGQPLVGNGAAESLGRGLALVSEDRKRYGLVLEKEIGFNLSLSSLQRLSSGGLVDNNAEVKENRKFFEFLRVKAPGLETPVSSLSGGNQQKVVIGKILMTGPQVVLLDEPTRGIDVGAKLEVYELINRLTADGKAVILISSEMPELLGMSDRLLILSEGKTGGEFTHTQVGQDELLKAAMAHG
jgi:D-xylose transport system ATP-binding protein